jgi:hypothetical protein
MAEQIINSRQSLEAYKEHLDAQWEKHKYLRVDAKTGKQRSLTQNASLHLYCQHVATALNDAGWDMKRFVKVEFDIPWTGTSVKDTIWREIQLAMLGKKSTTEPETGEYSQIYEVACRVISQRTGVFIAWPSKDSQDKNND